MNCKDDKTVSAYYVPTTLFEHPSVASQLKGLAELKFKIFRFIT